MNTDSTITGDRRRLAVCLFVAGALHAMVLLNVDLPAVRLPDPMPTIEIVLPEKPFSDTPPETADVETASTDELSAPDVDDAVPSPFTTPEAAEPLAVSPEPDRDAGPRRSVVADTTPQDLVRAITTQAGTPAASDLHALETGESSPRVRRLTGPPSGDPELAYYLDSWRRKVERIGNINYPSEARARGLSGTLRLLVVIDPDGALQDARILESSGHKLLDEGAVRIVNLAAPYSPFTATMRARIDSLEIERRWRFRKDRLTPM
ncbi:MAG: energy transducer TonB, partial [Chloroflexi bacterium]|nr:energy transducer TonB [Chloroflexota bacterium]